MLRAISERLREQGRHHWQEFGVIVASANIGLGVVLLGSVLTSSPPLPAAVASWWIAGASLIATALAYYSIQVGALGVFGRLRLRQTLLSFLVTGSELAMFLWPLYVLRHSSTLGFIRLRDWVFFFAAFAFAAAGANWDGARARKRQLGGAVAALSAYERRQRKDRINALIAGSVALGARALSEYRAPWAFLYAALFVATIGMIAGLVAQSRTSVGLERDVGI